jgi:hypothetical protein
LSYKDVITIECRGVNNLKINLFINSQKQKTMRNLSTKGLSMSQAQSVSNLCNQNALEIQRELESYNNCSKSIVIDKQSYVMQEASPINFDKIIEKLKFKGDLHACQAFLMEAVKAKDEEIERVQNTRPDFSDLVEPVKRDAPDYNIIPTVDESWGWSKLTDAEYSEYLQAEAMAAHLGQFIHKNGKLSSLRKELSNMPSIEWFNVEDGKKTPVKITKHHNSQDLLEIHEDIAEQHRQYEQRVNYFKAKVKNLVSDENARIQRENADMAAAFLSLEETLNREYRLAMDAYKGELMRRTMDFNSSREHLIKATAALRINVDPRFQKVIDLFMTSEK